MKLVLLYFAYFALESVLGCPRDQRTRKICAGFGACNTAGNCECDSTHYGIDCSLVKCPEGVAWGGEANADNSIHVLAMCSNRGSCFNGRCACEAGFTGAACQRLACPRDCSHNGQCVSLQDYATKNPYGKSHPYTTNWDANKIMGCKCDHGFSGVDCSLKICPTGDDPMTTGQVNEMQILTCSSSAGSFAVDFRESRGIVSYDASTAQLKAILEGMASISNVEISFSTGSTVCNDALNNIVTIEFKADFGNLPPLRVEEATTFSPGAQVRIMHGGASLGNAVSVSGTKEGATCSNRGICNYNTGKCDCFRYPLPGFRSSDGFGLPGNRGDCGSLDQSDKLDGGDELQSCPGTRPCSGRGTCSGSPSFTCQCQTGWHGGDCTLKSCPKGLSWFHHPVQDNVAHNILSTCSDAGNCDTFTGKCKCNDPFEGSACQYMKCPGNCEEHGECLNLKQIALDSSSNGASADFTYGSNPNNADQWDAEKIRACKCDTGYTGYDCRELKCLTGDDPSTDSQVDEVQLLHCTATSGSFTLTFRQQTSSLIAFSADAATIKTSLEALSSIGMVEVSFSSGTVACSDQLSGNHYILITFLTEHGDLPAIKASTTQLANAASGNTPGTGTILTATDGSVFGVFSSVLGTKENLECSNHGICDTSAGVCNCESGYSSSDGRGGKGTKSDCGHRLS